jgi:hypothetical protein
MDLRTPLRAALRVQVEAAWPDCARIYWPKQIVRLAIEKKMERDDGIPFAVIDLSGAAGLRPDTTGRFGATNYAETGIVEVTRFQWEDYTVTTMEAALLALQEQLRANPLAFGMRRRNSIGIDPEPNHPVWAYAINTDRPWQLGLLTVRVIVGETR